MSWPTVFLVSVVLALATVVYIFRLMRVPVVNARIIELEKRLLMAQQKIAAIESPARPRATMFPFHAGGAP